jgi:hypothetical protein
MQKAPRHTTTTTSANTPQHTRTPRHTALKWRQLPSPQCRLHLVKVPGQRTKQQPQSCMHLHSVGSCSDALAVETQTHPVQPEYWPQMRQVQRELQQGQQHKANAWKNDLCLSQQQHKHHPSATPQHAEAVAIEPHASTQTQPVMWPQLTA